MGALGLAIACLFAAGLWFFVGDALAGAETGLVFVLAALVFYIVVTAPRRLFDQRRVSQARESLLVAASAQACLQVTGSRPRAFMLIKPTEPSLNAAVAEATRRILLGTRVELAVSEACEHVASYSAALALRNVANMSRRDSEGDEEIRGMVVSSELSMETKLPVFMTICFFAPIMLILYAVFAHIYDPETLGELAALEFAVLDLTYYLTSADRSLR